jgi:hypothetical protein
MTDQPVFFRHAGSASRSCDRIHGAAQGEDDRQIGTLGTGRRHEHLPEDLDLVVIDGARCRA